MVHGAGSCTNFFSHAKGEGKMATKAGITVVLAKWIFVEVTGHFPDLKVKVVESFPDDIGEWKFVESGEDFTVQFVDSFPDIKIKYVNSFPGVE